MFLLIQGSCKSSKDFFISFTFHNVSINTARKLANSAPLFPALHSTMFLLIRLYQISTAFIQSSFTVHNVSINTSGAWQLAELGLNFTFHNVSIKTAVDAQAFPFFHPLHSTMFLLKHHSPEERPTTNNLYIPQCFY